jgi:hypothetical protein
MKNNDKHNILFIGGPHAGKTHFGGQLYCRLNSGRFKYKIAHENRPDDLKIFQEVFEKLYQGVRAGHTESNANKSVELIVEDSDNKVVLAFPDYAGEQVLRIVEQRRLNNTWKEYIDASTSWVLFIRLGEITMIEDIINREIPPPDEIIRRAAIAPPVKISDVAYFVELLQTLIYYKGVSTFDQVLKPNLTVMLSCWDELNLPENTIPALILKERLPLLYEYMVNTWDEQSLRIIGLSSTQKALTDEPDEEFIDKTPIEFGYYINPKGIREKDLTFTIETFLGK